MGVQAFCLGLPLEFCLFLGIGKISDSITQFIDFDSIFRSFNCLSIFSAPFELSRTRVFSSSKTPKDGFDTPETGPRPFPGKNDVYSN